MPSTRNDDTAVGLNLLVPEATPTATPPKRLFEYRGICIGLFSALLLSISNILIKKAHLTTGAEQTFVRYFIQASCMVFIILVNKLDFFGPRSLRGILILRGVFGTLGLICLQYSVKLINPSDAVALLHLNSVLVTIFARVYLKEKFSLAHLACLLCAVLGVLFIAQPSFIFAKFTNTTINSNATQVLEAHLAPPDSLNFIYGISLGIFWHYKVSDERIKTKLFIQLV